MSELKPCPCGKVPKTLFVAGAHDQPKWAYVSGDCCGTWEIEYRNNYAHIRSTDAMEAATEAWNSAPRGGK